MNQTLNTLLKNKKILVTGGTGTIGSELVSQLLQTDVNQIRIYSRDEHKHFWMSQKYGHQDKLRFLLGDVRDLSRLEKATQGVHYVFHAAALKHVPICEANPFEAIQTNVQGTQNLLTACLKSGVERVLGISTDKAAAPINVMGATKLLSEKILTTSVLHQGDHKLLSSAVRFGNVLGSRGSVLEVFLKQIREEGKVKITHLDMVRFIMTIPQAVHLVLKAFTIMQGSEVFILKMPVVKITDLAAACVEILSKRMGIAKSDIHIEESGIRPGEKTDEILMTEQEGVGALETDDLYILPSNLMNLAELTRHQYKNGKPASDPIFSTKNQKPLSYAEVLSLVESAMSG